MAVLDVPAECLAADLAGLEVQLRRTPQAAGIVDDAQALQRRGMGAAVLPCAERLKGGKRGSEEGVGTIVDAAGASRHQHRRYAKTRKRQRGDQARRAAADDGDGGLARGHGGPALRASQSPSFDQRRRPGTLSTAAATALRWPTRTTSCLPRVMPV